MQKSISKRLLAGILSIVMVLSLFITVPANTKAAPDDNKRVCTIEVNGLQNGSKMRAAVGVASVKLGSYNANVYAAGLYNVNNGKYDLDPDDRISIYSTNEFTFYVQPVDMTEWEQVTSAQVHWNNDAICSNATGYDVATVTISGGLVFFTVKNTPANYEVTPYSITAADTTLTYNTYVPTEMTFFNYAPISHGALTWSCTNDNGATWTYPTAVLVGTGVKNDPKSYYRVETILSATAGYVFADEADYTAAFAAYADPNGRTFKISDVSKDKKTAKLTISNIKVEEIGSSATAALTSLELTTEMNFASNEVIIPADAAAKMPKTFFATINGERKEVEITNLASGRCHWHIYSDPTCVSTSELPADAKFDTTTWSPLDAHYYYARLEWDTDWDYYNIGNEDDGTYKALKAIWYALYYEGVYTDPIGLIDAVEEDLGGFVVKFSVNAERDFGNGNKQVVPALNTIAAPTMNFYGYNTDYTCYVYGEGNPDCKYNEDPGYPKASWQAFVSGTSQACPQTGALYKASIAGQDGYRTASPVVYTYFDPTTNNTKTMKQGAVSIAVATPDFMAAVPSKLEGIQASMDLATGLDLNNYLMFWDPQTDIIDSEMGVQIFYPITDISVAYSVIVYIPVKKGYELTFTPEVKFNGKAATATEIVTAGGKTYLATMYTFDDAVSYSVTKDGAAKRLWSNIAQPFAGGTVQKELKATSSASRFYEFVDITWYENGVEFTGDTFAQGKRYTAVVTWDCSKFNIKEDCAVKEALVGDFLFYGINYVSQARITKSKKELTVTYEFPAADYPEIASVNEINIDVPNGMEDTDFYKYVASQLVATLNFKGGTTGVKVLDGMVFNRGTAVTWEPFTHVNEDDALIVKAALEAAYPGVLAYNKNNKAAQDFALTGYLNTAVYNGSQRTRVNINIHVAGTKSVITFNPNGGVYTGSTILAENGLAYNFKYVADQIYREGYFFAGWFTAAEGGSRVKAATKFDGKTTTLYAHWVKVFTGKVWTLKAASYNAGRLTATATAPKTKVDGYEFSISKDGVNWTVNSQTKNVRYYVGLVSGTYFVKVRAYRRDSAGKLVYGAYSTTQKVVVK